MKKSIIILFCFLVHNIAFTQSEKFNRNTLGLNFNYALDQLVFGDDEQPFYQLNDDHETIIQYKHLGKNADFRLALGFLDKKLEEDFMIPFYGGAGDYVFTQKDKVFFIGIGFQKRKNIIKNFDFFCGLDALSKLRWINYKLDGDTDNIFYYGGNLNFSTKINSRSFGTRGFIGLEYFIINSLSISTESSINFWMTRNNFKDRNDSFFIDPQLNSEYDKDRFSEMQLVPPLNIYVNFHF